MPPIHTCCRTACRGFALAFSTIALTNLLAGYDANLWWIDVRPLGSVGRALLIAGAVAMLAWAVRPAMSRMRQRITIGLTVTLASIAAINAVTVVALDVTGRVDAHWLSMSAGLACLLGGAAYMMHRPVPPGGWPVLRGVGVAAAAGGFVVLLALGQMYTLGLSDYRRPVDAVVVFGARTYADGRPSLALADRVRTGVEIYQEGFTQVIVMSGGPGDGDVHETQAMRDLAMEMGVPADAIVLDPEGVNTRATAANTATLPYRRLIAVSHFYHLPRIRMAYQQCDREVLTVPAKETRTLNAMPYYVAREVAAWWFYHARSLAG